MPLPRLLLPLALASLALLAPAASAAEHETALLNVYARQPFSLNGKWSVIIDPYENGYYNYRRQPHDAASAPSAGYFLDRKPADKSDLVEYNFDTADTLKVPGDWNSHDPRLLYYEGTLWYRRLFDYTPTAGHRVFLYLGAANYQADVYLNGKKLGQHLGGFTPFNYEVTALLKPAGNSLVVRVDNQRHVEGVPTNNSDWWNYGGLTRDVLLVETPATLIRDYHIQLAKGSRDHITATVRLDALNSQPSSLNSQLVTVSIPQLQLTASAATDASGVAHLEFTAPSLALWSPEYPQRYTVEIAAGADHLAEQIGFRTIETRGADLLLNGAPVFLRGICLHEENPLRGGRVTTEGEARMLLGWAKELGCNFVRLAHYPHNEFMARVADELGLMLWEEVPVYWTIQWENPATFANAQAQLTDLVVRDRNRASVIVWSVANETPVGEARTSFLKNLIATARALDPARLVSAAMEIHATPEAPDHKIVDDPLGAFTDILSFNQYVGWYDGTPAKLDRVTWTLAYEKPVMISEFGADALQGLHADALTRFSEEYQEDLYRRTLAMLQKIPQWRGCTPWILCDFRSPRRPLAHIQDGWNRKGLIGENGTKKKAFYVLKNFYDAKAAAATSEK